MKRESKVKSEQLPGQSFTRIHWAVFPGVDHEGSSLRLKTNENSATKARRHKGILFFLTWCLGVFMAIFMVENKDKK
jgi:hypothetical protein